MLILSRKTDQQIKIGVEAPRNVKVFRQEVFNAIKSENTAAAAVNTEKIEGLSKILSK